MTAVSVEVLAGQVAAIRENPTIAYDESKNLSLSDIGETMAATRAALVEAVENASDSAFEAQPENEAGEEVWSVGQIVGHCNGALLGIGGSAIGLIGVDLGDPPADLQAVSEPKVMSRDEALAAVNVADTAQFFAMIPDDENLDNSETHDFFGPMSGRAWLYFAAMHEAEHVNQIKALG